MGKTLVVAEKPSVGRDIARALGVKSAAQTEGMIENEEYVISWAIGHLVSLCDPDELNPEWKKWRMESLPMLPDVLQTKVLPKTKKQFSVLKKLLNSKEVDRVVCATDSGRDGSALFIKILDGVEKIQRRDDAPKRKRSKEATHLEVIAGRRTGRREAAEG